MSTKTNVISDLKIFMVEVTTTQQVPVLAASKKEAEEIAESCADEDFDNGSDRDTSSVAYEINAADKTDEQCIPWGLDDDHPRRDWTIKQWFDARAGGQTE